MPERQLSTIKLNSIPIYAYHGCLPEEGIIGGKYIVDVTISADLQKAFSSDKLSDTVDYTEVYQIVRTQMSIRSNLIEHVAKRIADNLVKLAHVAEVEVTVTKITPPLNGDVPSVSATVIVP